MEQEWFEFVDIKKRQLSRHSWIPVCAAGVVREAGEVGYKGYMEEYFRATSIVLPIKFQNDALKIRWDEIEKRGDNSPCCEDGVYIKAGAYSDWNNKIKGSYLVLEQLLETEDNNVWHLDQDFVLALKLIREGDKWLSPTEGYTEVACLKRDKKKKPVLLEIRADYLRDYLCARNSGLLIATFRSRIEILDKSPHITWPKDEILEEYEWGQWIGRTRYITEGGFSFDAEVKFLRASRTDVDPDEDVPSFEFPNDDNIVTESCSFRHKGKKLTEVRGEIWKKDWIAPSKFSPRVRKDEIESTIPFIIDNEGNTAISSELYGVRKWLWFKPTVVCSLLEIRGGLLGWYTEDTGCIGAISRDCVHFGVNKIGMINVYAKDIAELPEWQKKIWIAHNVAPEGGVSEELLMSQMEAKPASTISPEVTFFEELGKLQRIFESQFSLPLFREHFLQDSLMKNIHRFLAVDKKGLFLLSKEITRLIIERINIESLKKLRPKEDKKLESIKRIEKLINETGLDGRKITGPLVGVYNLRMADAHLPSSDISEAFKLAGLNEDNNNFLKSGKILIKNIATCISSITDGIKKL